MSQQEDLVAQLALAQGLVSPLQLFDAYQEHERQGGRLSIMQVLQAQKAITAHDGASVRGLGTFEKLSLEDPGRRRMADVFTALLAVKAGAAPPDTLRGGLHRQSQPGGAQGAALTDILAGLGWITVEKAQALRGLQSVNLVTCNTCRWILRAREKEAPPKICPRCKSLVVKWTPPPPQAFATGVAPAASPARQVPASAGTDDATLAEAPDGGAQASATPLSAPTLLDADLRPPTAGPAAPGEAGFQDSATMAEITPEAAIPPEAGTVIDILPPPSGAHPAPAAAGEAGFQDSATIAEIAAPAPVHDDAATLAEIPPAVPVARVPGIPKGLDAASFQVGSPEYAKPKAKPKVPSSPEVSGTMVDVDAPEIGELRRPAGAAPAPPDAGATVADAGADVPSDAGRAAISDLERSTAGPPGSGAQKVVRSGPTSEKSSVARSSAPATSSAPPGSKSETDATHPGAHKAPAAPRKSARSTSVGTISPEMMSQIRSTGKVFGDYYLLDKLGQGGMGAVYKGYDTKFNRFVAVKLLMSSGGENDALVTRFYREARAAAQLRHPNVMPVHDVGQVDNTFYMVMDYCAGSSLDKEVRSPEKKLFPKGEKPTDGRNPGLEVKTALKIMRDVCSATDLAHQNNIIHRDLKPANILVSPEGNVQLTDFGLARDLTESNVHLTKSGITLGTPLYMSPEQGAGDSSQVDARSDIYSLGCIAYELFVGRPPFEGNDTMSVLVKHMHLEPVPPRNLIPHLDPQIETVILKCLEKEKSRRYATAGELAEDFDLLLKGENIRTSAPSIMHKVRRWTRRNRQFVMWASVAAASLSIASYFGYQSLVLEEQQDVAKKEAAVKDRLNQAGLRLGEARTLVNEAQLARRQGKLKSIPDLVNKAGQKAQEALGLNAELLEAWVVRAEADRVGGRWDEALASLDKVFAKDPKHARARFVAGNVGLDRWYQELVDSRASVLPLSRLVLGKPFQEAELTALLSPDAAEAAKPDMGGLRAQAAGNLGQAATGAAAETEGALAQGLALLLQDPKTQIDGARAALEKSARQQDKLDEAWLGLALAAQWQGDESASLDAYQKLAQLDQGRTALYRDRIFLAVVAALRPGAGGDRLVRTLRDALGDLDRLEQIDPEAIGLLALRPWILYGLAQTGHLAPAEAKQIFEEAQSGLRRLDANPGAPRGPERHFLEGKILAQLARVESELKGDPTPTLTDAVQAFSKGLAAGPNADYLEVRADTYLRLARELRQLDRDAREPLRLAIEDFGNLMAGGAAVPEWSRRRGSAWLDLAEVLNLRKEDSTSAFESASKDLTAFLDQHPDDMAALRLRIRANGGLSGRYGLAKKREEKLKYSKLNEADCRRALAAAPEDGELYLLLGDAEAMIGTDENASSEDRSKYFIAAEQHYAKAIELKDILAWHNLAMLYLAVGNDTKALQALKKLQASLPKPSPDLEDQISQLESDQSTLLKRDLDEAKDLAMRGDYEKAEEKYVSGLKKLFKFLSGLDEKETAEALSTYSANLASASYDLACIYAQASIGKSGAGKDRAKKPTPAEAKEYVEKAFVQLAQAEKYYYGRRIGKDKTLVKDSRLVDSAHKDADMDPVKQDPRWKAFLDKLDKLPEEK